MHVTDGPSLRVEQLPRNIIYIDAPHRARVSSFRFFHQRYVTAVRPAVLFPGDRPDPGPARSGPVRAPLRHDLGGYIAARRALLLRVLRAKPGEHSFAEEAKVANYRVASREGGLMRSPMTGHIRPPFCSCRWTMARRRFHVGVKEHRPLRKSHYRRARLRLSSPRLHPALRPEPISLFPPLSFYRILLGSFLFLTGTSSFFSHGSYSTGSREIRGEIGSR